jgi:IS5 family transposase
MLKVKILLLQAMHGLSDERCEYLIKDRLSFMGFLGLEADRSGAGRQRDLGVP